MSGLRNVRGQLRQRLRVEVLDALVFVNMALCVALVILMFFEGFTFAGPPGSINAERATASVAGIAVIWVWAMLALRDI